MLEREERESAKRVFLEISIILLLMVILFIIFLLN